jgi:hypothetical protein
MSLYVRKSHEGCGAEITDQDKTTKLKAEQTRGQSKASEPGTQGIEGKVRERVSLNAIDIPEGKMHARERKMQKLIKQTPQATPCPCHLLQSI